MLARLQLNQVCQILGHYTTSLLPSQCIRCSVRENNLQT